MDIGAQIFMNPYFAPYSNKGLTHSLKGTNLLNGYLAPSFINRKLSLPFHSHHSTTLN